jgi:protein required for attachment to host cells
MKSVRTLVLVADDAFARLLIHESRGGELREIAGTSIEQYAEGAAAFADRQGRSGFGAKGTAMQTFAPRQTLDDYQRANFARHIVETLEEAVHANRPQRLVVVAPPKMLGVLRKDLPEALHRLLSAEIAKDLVKVPVHDLPHRLAEALPR